MSTGLFVTQARGIREEEPFIQSHRAYAARHGLDHRVVTDIPFPEWMSGYDNPYKFGKSFILVEALKAVPYVLFAESDVMITNLDVAPPRPRGGNWLRAGTCRPSNGEGPCICPCILAATASPAAIEFLGKSIELLADGFPDGFPFDEALFHETRRALGWPQWDMDSTLCGYHNAEYRDALTRPWFPGDFALHVSGVAWLQKLEVLRSTMRGPHLLPGVSVVVVCMDRNTRLAATLPSWVNDPRVAEVIAVDWSSSVPLARTLSDMLLTTDKLRIIRVEGESEFNLGRAYNAALRYVRHDVTLKIDADYLLAQPEFIGELLELRSGAQFSRHFFTGHFSQAAPQLNGLVVGLTRRLQSVGYREDFNGWGFDDDDFYNRLQLSQLSRQMLRGLSDKVIHVPHGDDVRTMRYATQSLEDSWSKNLERSSFPIELPNRHYEVLHSRPKIVALSAVPPQPSRRLASPDAYSDVFGSWRGCKVAFHCEPSLGNTGDHLITEATRQLFAHYDMQEVPMADADVAMFGGGGSMGDLYPQVVKSRRKFFKEARSRGIATVLLPQSWNAHDATADLADRIFCRDRRSMEFCPSAQLAPDLALAWRGPVFAPEMRRDLGIFMRRDKESAEEHPFADPAALRRTPTGYVSLAAGFRRIETDRLHFAIAALLAGCEVTLLPNSYQKNLGVYETWLSSYDCAWADRPSTNQPPYQNEPSRSSCRPCQCCSPAESESPETRAV